MKPFHTPSYPKTYLSQLEQVWQSLKQLQDQVVSKFPRLQSNYSGCGDESTACCVPDDPLHHQYIKVHVQFVQF